MTKQTGLGDRLYFGGRDLSGDIGSLSNIGGGPEALEVTGIRSFGKERLGGKRDGRIEFSSWFNPAADQAHDVFSALPTSDVGVLYSRGATTGVQAAGMVAKQVNYDGTRGEDGSLEWSVQAAANGFGLEWGQLLTNGYETLTTATNGASIDAGAASTNGVTFFVQIGPFVTTSASILLEQSSDNGVGDPWATLTGSQVSLAGTGGPQTNRVTVAGAVERYLRLAVTGTFTSIPIAAAVARRLVATVF